MSVPVRETAPVAPGAGRLGSVALGVHAAVIGFSLLAFTLAVGRTPPEWLPGDLWSRVYGLGMRFTGQAYIVAGFLAALGGWAAALGWRRALRSSALLVGLALAAELLGTATGWPFGPYAYGDLLGYRITGLVPWVIPLSWFTMTYAALALALRSWWGPVGTAAWTAWGLVAWDLLMDPAMSRALPFWSWGVEGGYFGTPLSNLGGWLLVGTLLGGVAVVVSRPGAMVLRRQRLPLLLYVLNGLFPLTLAALEGMWAAAGIGAAAMGLFLWLVLGGLPQRLHALRDRVFASPAFQRWAGAVPFTRPVAVARSRRVFELTTGFVFTQTVLACFRLGVFERLRDGPVELEVLASDWGLEPDAARRLLEAAEVLELVERRGWTRFGLGRLGAPLVGNAPVRAMMEHNLLLYDDLRNPVELLAKGGGPDTHLGRYWPYAGSRRPQDLEADEVAGYSTLMTRSHGLVSAEVLDRYPFKRHRRVLDVGGGEGGFAGSLAAAVPSLDVTLFDLPAVAARAEARLNGDGPGGAGRVTVVGGDFFQEPLPGGRDLVTLLRIVHDHDDEEVVHLLRKVHEALVPGGTVLVAEPMADVPGAESVGAAYFSWYLFAMGTGRPRSPGEIEALLREAGFRGIRPVPSRVPVQTGMLVARRR